MAANMAIRAVVFDIGGVLEVTPATGWQTRWEETLRLESGAIDTRLHDVYRAGSVGAMTLAEAERRIAAILDLDEPALERVRSPKPFRRARPSRPGVYIIAEVRNDAGISAEM